MSLRKCTPPNSAFIRGVATPRAVRLTNRTLDADVTATPNYDIGVLDPAAPDFFGRTVSTTFPQNVYAPSQIARDQAINYFSSNGMNHILFSPVGTDAFTFNEALAHTAAQD